MGRKPTYTDHLPATRRNFFITDGEFEHLRSMDPTGKREATAGLRALVAASRAAARAQSTAANSAIDGTADAAA